MGSVGVIELLILAMMGAGCLVGVGILVAFILFVVKKSSGDK
ncbi:hypothetical protein [Bremerella alba]|uniref:Uncharacterized protein n=1 Tax=Bremerella alba TaxID=980252 RepID=A0A7V8V1A9_9BACT|nr:hypothetical protein [Bremerella alba]MBA2113100.1 hypothetical protein [Bremerella alba]